MSQDISVVELFAGVGGFRLGLETASSRYKTVWANQWEPGRKIQHAYACYVQHFGQTASHSNENISIAKDAVPSHQLLVGGFPCQDYSVAATQAKGIEGKKGVLWWEIYDILTRVRPPYVLLENVDRLIKSPTRQRGRDFGVILKCFEILGYTVEWRVINAAEYGYAQKRRRVFIFAYHSTTPFHRWIEQKSAEEVVGNSGFFSSAFPVEQVMQPSLSLGHAQLPDDIVTVSNEFVYLFKNAGIMRSGAIFSHNTTPVFEPQTMLHTLLENDPVEDRYFNFDLDKVAYLKGSKRENRIKPNGDPYFYTEGSIPFPDNLYVAARTILTSEGKMNRSTHYVVDKTSGRIRTLTPVECERINGFPDNWTNTGMPEAFRYFTMGNALVVPVITRLGEQLLKIIDGQF
jgi:DNA (cytosine-5)-methyltransferase 1